jgi:hypothetical protein
MEWGANKTCHRPPGCLSAWHAYPYSELFRFDQQFYSPSGPPTGSPLTQNSAEAQHFNKICLFVVSSLLKGNNVTHMWFQQFFIGTLDVDNEDTQKNESEYISPFYLHNASHGTWLRQCWHHVKIHTCKWVATHYTDGVNFSFPFFTINYFFFWIVNSIGRRIWKLPKVAGSNA